MSDFADRAAALAGADPATARRLAGGDLNEVIVLATVDGGQCVAKAGPDVTAEAAMLRAMGEAGMPVPRVIAAEQGVLLLSHVENDGAPGWRDLGTKLARMHGVRGEFYGWDRDYRFGDVVLANARTDDWRQFWWRQRLVETARPLGGDWLRRIEALGPVFDDILPAGPAVSLLHGDLWSGNILWRNGRLAALIDPACYYGHAEVDLAMLHLFGTPGQAFYETYGALEPGWEERRAAYQLFPALVHLRLFGSGYAGMVDRLLTQLRV